MKHRTISLILALSLVFALCIPSAGAWQSDLTDAREEEGVVAEAALLADADSGTILFAQNAEETLYPASTTKVMTALLVCEALERGELSLDQLVAADDTAWQGLNSSSSTAGIRLGEELTVEDLLYCMLLASANEAANILAVAVSGSIEDFVDRMNQRAAELGCTGTHFSNTNGMPKDDHYTTATDLFLIFREALNHDLFRTIIGTASHTVPATNLTEEPRYLSNTNALIQPDNRYYYPACIGGKTGYTDAAKYCLISAAEQDGVTLICVMMGCDTITYADGSPSLQYRCRESISLYDWGFENFSLQTIQGASEVVTRLAVTGDGASDDVAVVPEEELSVLLPDDVSVDAVELVTDLPDSVQAPVEAGQTLGTVTALLDGEVLAQTNLTAQTAVELAPQPVTLAAEEEEQKEETWENSQETSSDGADEDGMVTFLGLSVPTGWFAAVIVVLCVVVAAIVVIWMLLARRSRRRAQSRGRRSAEAAENRNKASGGSGVARVIIIVCLAVFLFCALYLALYVLEQRWQSRSAQDAVNRFVLVDEVDSGETTEDDEEDTQDTPEAEEETTEGLQTVAPTIDFEALWEVSPYVVGWIQISGLDQVNYPIVRYTDNDYYLDHSWDGASSRYGAIFLDANCDLYDPYALIYGHNMRNLSMFGGLKQYRDQSFYEENGGIVTIYLPTETRTYQIFSVQVVAPDDAGVYTIGYNYGDSFNTYLQTMASRSLYRTGVGVSGTDNVITLSTCSGDDRLVASAKLISTVVVGN